MIDEFAIGSYHTAKRPNLTLVSPTGANVMARTSEKPVIDVCTDYAVLCAAWPMWFVGVTLMVTGVAMTWGGIALTSGASAMIDR